MCFKMSNWIIRLKKDLVFKGCTQSVTLSPNGMCVFMQGELLILRDRLRKLNFWVFHSEFLDDPVEVHHGCQILILHLPLTPQEKSKIKNVN